MNEVCGIEFLKKESDSEEVKDDEKKVIDEDNVKNFK